MPALDVCDERLEIANVEGFPIQGPYHGHEGVREWTRDLFEVLDEARVEVVGGGRLDDPRRQGREGSGVRHPAGSHRCRGARGVARAMSQENVERVLRGYEALNRGDLEGAVAGLSPDCELTLPPILPEPDLYEGREGLRRFWANWQETFEEFRMEIEETIDAGDQVVVMAAASGTGKDSGAEVHTPTFPIVWTLQDDQVVRMEAHPTRAAALEAVGLSE